MWNGVMIGWLEFKEREQEEAEEQEEQKHIFTRKIVIGNRHQLIPVEVCLSSKEVATSITSDECCFTL
jgi:hypothetical protein